MLRVVAPALTTSPRISYRNRGSERPGGGGQDHQELVEDWSWRAAGSWRAPGPPTASAPLTGRQSVRVAVSEQLLVGRCVCGGGSRGLCCFAFQAGVLQAARARSGWQGPVLNRGRVRARCRCACSWRGPLPQQQQHQQGCSSSSGRAAAATAAVAAAAGGTVVPLTCVLGRELDVAAAEGAQVLHGVHGALNHLRGRAGRWGALAGVGLGYDGSGGWCGLALVWGVTGGGVGAWSDGAPQRAPCHTLHFITPHPPTAERRRKCRKPWGQPLTWSGAQRSSLYGAWTPPACPNPAPPKESNRSK